jgi:hypothetical protein
MNSLAIQPAPYLKPLLRAFWVGVGLVAALFAYKSVSTTPLHLLFGIGVAFFSLIPTYLWCAGKVRGLPMLPGLGALHLLVFAFPIVGKRPDLLAYDISAVAVAALTVMGYLALLTLTWYRFARNPVPAPRSFVGMPEKGFEWVFHCCIIIGITFQMATLYGFFWGYSTSVVSLIKAICLTLNNLGAAILAYRWGRGNLSLTNRVLYVGLMGAYFMVATATSLGLASGVFVFLLGVGMFTYSRGRFPALVMGAAAVLLFVLHAGKAEMRQRHWGRGKELIRSAKQLPRLYYDWIETGLRQIPDMGKPRRKKDVKESFLERSALIQMLLLVQKKSPSVKPFLMGKTYEYIPESLVPRILWEDKPVNHAATYLMAVYYGIQTPQQTKNTTIGFGLIPEAYANFGYLGVAALALILGTFVGQATRLTANFPVMSFRGLFGLLVMGMTVHTEQPAAGLIGWMFQGTVVLFVFGVTMMTTQTVAPPVAWARRMPPLLPATSS